MTIGNFVTLSEIPVDIAVSRYTVPESWTILRRWRGVAAEAGATSPSHARHATEPSSPRPLRSSSHGGPSEVCQCARSKFQANSPTNQHRTNSADLTTNGGAWSVPHRERLRFPPRITASFCGRAVPRCAIGGSGQSPSLALEAASAAAWEEGVDPSCLIDSASSSISQSCKAAT